MKDAEISKALAMAIGWPESDIDASGYWVFVCYEVATLAQPATWRIFDYRNPTVIWPIAERYDCFPMKVYSKIPKWQAITNEVYESDTAAKAVAIAVIGKPALCAIGERHGHT